MKLKLDRQMVVVVTAIQPGYEFLYDEHGVAVAGYAGCGTHQLEVTQAFVDAFCEGVQ